MNRGLVSFPYGRRSCPSLWMNINLPLVVISNRVCLYHKLFILQSADYDWMFHPCLFFSFSLSLWIAFSIGIERKDEIKLHIMGRPSVEHLFWLMTKKANGWEISPNHAARSNCGTSMFTAENQSISFPHANSTLWIMAEDISSLCKFPCLASLQVLN